MRAKLESEAGYQGIVYKQNHYKRLIITFEQDERCGRLLWLH